MNLMNQIRFFFILMAPLLLASCGAKPAKKTNKDTIPQQEGASVALWAVVGDKTFQQRISRFDLATGGSEQKLIEAPSTDTAIIGDNSQLFVLSRSGTYSVSRFVSASGKIKDEAKLTKLDEKESNAQEALVDSQGKIWITDYNSNKVRVYKNGLQGEPDLVDLSEMAAEDDDKLAEIKSVLETLDGYIVVGAQQMKRPASGTGNWAVHDYSRIAWIDRTSLKVIHIEKIPASNLNQIFSLSKSKLLAVASGLQLEGGANGALVELTYEEKNGKLEVTQNLLQSLEGKVFGAAYSTTQQKLYYNLWQPTRGAYCFYADKKEILCDPTYMPHLILHKDRAYVGLSSPASEIWVWDLTLDPPKLLRKVSVEGTLNSLSFGP